MLAVAAAVAVTLHVFVLQSFTVPSSAMLPTLRSGDRVLVVKWKALVGPLARGEVVVFRPSASATCSAGQGGSSELAGRIIGLPGETIWSAHDHVYLDGRPLVERGWYDQRFGQLGGIPIARTTIPQGEYFVLGDDRRMSCDSRRFGPIPASSVVGQIVALVLRQGHLDVTAF
jgi:signal peptidase I